MGNCNSLHSSSTTTTTDHHNTPPNGGIKVLPPTATPPPRSQHHHHSSASGSTAVGRVLGRPREDVRNTYIFGRELGRGQFGVTYLVTHKETKQHFACKSIASRKLINRDDIEDVRREVQIMHHLTGHRSTLIQNNSFRFINLINSKCRIKLN
jgi:calcium-dependent protein kinase